MTRTRCLLAVLALQSAAVMAAPNQWTRTGPDGGPAWSIDYATMTPGVALAVAGHEIYRTTDNGVSWTEVHGLGVADNVRIARDPGNANRLVVGGSGIQTVRTEDGGRTYT